MCVTQKYSETNDDFELIVELDYKCKNISKPKAVEKCRIDLENCQNNDGSFKAAFWITEEWNRVFIFNILITKDKKYFIRIV